MSNVSIEKDGVVFTFQMGDPDTVTVEKRGNLDENSMPASDSDGAFVLDFNGVIKIITVSGVITAADTTRTSSGADVKTISEQIAWLEALVDGTQDGYTFNSTFQSGKTVYCRRFKTTEKAGEVTKSPFTLELVEGL